MNIQKTDTLLQGYLNFTLGVKSNHSQIEGFKFFPKLKTTALEYIFLSYVNNFIKKDSITEVTPPKLFGNDENSNMFKVNKR